MYYHSHTYFYVCSSTATPLGMHDVSSALSVSSDPRTKRVGEGAYENAWDHSRLQLGSCSCFFYGRPKRHVVFFPLNLVGNENRFLRTLGRWQPRRPSLKFWKQPIGPGCE